MSSLKELSRSLSRYGLKVSDAEEFASILVDVLNEGLRTDKQVKIKGLGTFKVTSVSARESVNVNTGERIVLDGHDKISFTPDATMRDIVNAPFAQFETVNIEDDADISKIEEPVGVEDASVDEKYEAVSVDDKTVKGEAQPSVVEEKPTKEVVVDSAEEQVDEQAAKPILGSADEQSLKTVVETVAETADEQSSKSVEVPVVDTSVEQNSQPVAEPVVDKEIKEEAKVDSLGSVVDRVDAKASDEKQEKRSYLVPVLFSIIIFILLGGGFAIYHLVGELNRSNERLDSLIIQMNSNKQAIKSTAQLDTIGEEANDNADNVNTNEILAEQAKAQKAAEEKARKAAAAEAAKQRTAAQETKQQAPKTKVVSEEPISERPEKLSLLEKAKIKAAALKRATQKGINNGKQKVNDVKESLVGEHDKYAVANNYDARVRTGAYKIVGVSHIVKVKPGQTLSSISRTYLGPGMECYLEAVNGSSSFKEGQVVKIPELKLKKK